MRAELPCRDLVTQYRRQLDIQRLRVTMVDRHVMIITHVSFVPHSSYETYETDVRNVTYATVMAGEPRITFISVGWVSEDGSVRIIDLPAMQQHCRPERVQDLLEDLDLLCEDVDAGRRPEDKGRPLSLVHKS
jgi:hypothetical protein